MAVLVLGAPGSATAKAVCDAQPLRFPRRGAQALGAPAKWQGHLLGPGCGRCLRFPLYSRPGRSPNRSGEAGERRVREEGHWTIWEAGRFSNVGGGPPT